MPTGADMKILGKNKFSRLDVFPKRINKYEFKSNLTPFSAGNTEEKLGEALRNNNTQTRMSEKMQGISIKTLYHWQNTFSLTYNGIIS